MDRDADVTYDGTGSGRVTLVLGGGWRLGGAFHAGVILAMLDSCAIDARRVDALIGTSSGAVVAGLLTAGMSPEDLFRRETGQILSSAGRDLLGRLDRSIETVMDTNETPQLGREAGVAIGGTGREVSPGGALVGLLPRGTRSMEPLEQYFDHLVGAHWPNGTDVRFCAVELGSGRRVALSRHCGVTVGQAVAASCSIPGLSEPVRIDDREYVDGAVHSINNADLAAAAMGATCIDRVGTGPPDFDHGHPEPASLRLDTEGPDDVGTSPHTVVVSAPLSARSVQFAPGPIALLRNAMRAQTRLELRKLPSSTRIVLIEPTAADIAAMGSNLNADNRRRRVARRAYVTASAAFRAAELHG